MRILVLNDYGHVNGGAAKVALDSAAGLSARGHDVTLLAAVGPFTAKVPTIALEQSDLLGDRNRLRAGARSIWNGAAADALAGLLDDCDPSETIVHIHGYTKALSASVIAEALSARFPTVLTLHDYFTVCPNGALFDYPKGKVCRRVPLSPACLTANCDARARSHKAFRVARHLVQNTRGRLQELAHLIAVSDFSRDIMAPWLPPKAKIHRVDNPIAVDEALSSSAPCTPGNTLLYIGRLSIEKGPQLLAEAARKADLRVRFVGDGPLLSSLRARYPEHRFDGWLSGAALEEAYRSARALVVPSLWYETLGLVVLEAAARGRGVIVADGTAPAELIKDEETGLLFRNGDITDLSQKLLRMHSEPSLATELGLRGWKRFWQSPSTLMRHCERLEEVYGVMLSGNEALHAG